MKTNTIPGRNILQKEGGYSTDEGSSLPLAVPYKTPSPSWRAPSGRDTSTEVEERTNFPSEGIPKTKKGRYLVMYESLHIAG